MYKKWISLIVCCFLLAGLALPVYADEPEQPETKEIYISTAEEFLEFAENCRLDTYSRNLLVYLEKNIDLSGRSFDGVPIFNGTFDGRGHKIYGLEIAADGSMQGLFRYLTASATVQNLTVKGEVHPGGSANEVGGIAGRSEGAIRNCVFSGNVSGCDYVGGLAGTNGITGVIEKSRVEGEVHGDHFVGGVAGCSSGVIRNCTNRALINTTPQQNDIELSDITIDTLTNTESANTVTDIGGIAGLSSGVIRECKNNAAVGYRHMGYNIGGIAGTQSGYLTGCVNTGNVQGRKEIGGIVGQMEPAASIEYTQDTLQILQGQLSAMSGMVNRASGNAQNNAAGITGQLGVLQEQTRTAVEAVETLLPEGDDLKLPDNDTILAAQNTLSATLNAMPSTVNKIATATETTLYSLTRDLNAISNQISAMGQTINQASENLGGTVMDISDEDTPDTLTGKVEGCINYGHVLADLNVGGIAGAIAMENDLDILEDWQSNGDESLNFSSEVRAVIRNCENQAVVTGGKQNVGGIVGWQSLGLVKESISTGKVDAENADFAGGISGMSTGFIRTVYAKCEIVGKTCVGGIAGSATIVTDSLSQVKLEGVREKQGAILGTLAENDSDEEQPLGGNYYLCVGKDPGAIDGISYSGKAEPRALEDFLSIENLPELFRSVTVRFRRKGDIIKEITLAPGEKLDAALIPAISEQASYAGSWEGLEEAQLDHILFDLTFDAMYLTCDTVIQSEKTRENGLPLLLVEGSFTDEETVSVAESAVVPALNEKQTLLEVWDIALPEEGTSVRFRLPDSVDAETLKLMEYTAEGLWSEISFVQDGSYLVFVPAQCDGTIALVEVAQDHAVLYITAAIVLAVGGFVVLRKKKNSTNRKEEIHEAG